jgi:N6-adenosine-specific RNA methylase IME4
LTPFPPGKFGAILCDPPWPYQTFSAKGKGRSAKSHYDTMALDDIRALPVGRWAADDCVLFLWAHNSLLPAALDVMAAWGFTYRARGFTWLKVYPERDDLFPQAPRPVVGLGKWTRLSTELCFLGTRGTPRPFSHDVREVIVAPRREHSRKPDEIYALIERLVPGPYLELFSSSSAPHRPGWTRWVGKDRAAVRRWPSNSYPGEAACGRSTPGAPQ